MTLLSIREQEAVKAVAASQVVNVKTVSGGVVRFSFFDDKDLEARDRALILATRDAIARQVREEAVRLENAPGAHPIRAAIHRDAATFIEGLVCDSTDTSARGR